MAGGNGRENLDDQTEGGMDLKGPPARKEDDRYKVGLPGKYKCCWEYLTVQGKVDCKEALSEAESLLRGDLSAGYNVGKTPLCLGFGGTEWAENVASGCQAIFYQWRH